MIFSSRYFPRDIFLEIFPPWYAPDSVGWLARSLRRRWSQPRALRSTKCTSGMYLQIYIFVNIFACAFFFLFEFVFVNIDLSPGHWDQPNALLANTYLSVSTMFCICNFLWCVFVYAFACVCVFVFTFVYVFVFTLYCSNCIRLYCSICRSGCSRRALWSGPCLPKAGGGA